MNKKKNKKKKGFTLIELVIVLAVLAIIALIAIPNFTKVRNDSLAKADARTVEQIEKITLMAIANEDIKVASQTFTIEPTDNGVTGENEIKGTLVGNGKKSYSEMLKEVKKPQVNGTKRYKVHVTDNGDVTVTTTK